MGPRFLLGCYIVVAQPETYIGSADLMERNLDRRVEVLCLVLDPELSGYLRDVVLQAYLSDTEQVTTLGADGTIDTVRILNSESRNQNLEFRIQNAFSHGAGSSRRDQGSILNSDS